MKAPYNDLVSAAVSENAVRVGELLGYINLKAVWLVYLRPDMPAAEIDERYRRELATGLQRLLESLLLPNDETLSPDENDRRCERINKADPLYSAGREMGLIGEKDPFMDTIRHFDVRSTIAAYAGSWAKNSTPESFRQLADRGRYATFADLMSQIERFETGAASAGFQDRDTEVAVLAMISVVRRINEQLIPLSRADVTALKTLTNELMLFLQAHPDAIIEMHWKAFQELVWEKFAFEGYHVKDVSRIRNSGGDLIAIQQEGGKQVRHLVEIKRYKDKVGMDVFNQVVGAADSSEFEHVFLVTSSDVTSDVLTAAEDRKRLSQEPGRKAKFKNIVVDLVNGKRLTEWLREYRVRTDGGLWLSEHWDMEPKGPEGPTTA